MTFMTHYLRPGTLVMAAGLLAACEGGLDLDMRGLGDGFDTTEAAQAPTAPRPQPDTRGVISYPGYQVALARRGDTVTEVAARVGLDPQEVAQFNRISTSAVLRDGELIALPSRVAEPSPATGSIGTGPILPADDDITQLAGQAIERAGAGSSQRVRIPGEQTGIEPVRHQVQPGETAFTIARLYGVPVSAIADWNGLGADLEVRTGQFLLIPPAGIATAALPDVDPSRPGQGTITPAPPSAATPLPAAPAAAVPAPASPQMAEDQTEASDTARLRMPVDGKIIRAYEKGSNDGIGIAAAAGTAVRAADDGTVAAITRDTDQVPILVIRHANNLLTVYAGVDAVAVDKGDSVSRGQAIAKVRSGSPSFLHFEVREGFDSVDPMPYLN